MPGCAGCVQAKDALSAAGVAFEVHDLKAVEGHESFKQFYPQLRKTLHRKESGELDLPILVGVDGNGQVLQFFEGRQRIEALLKARC